MLMLRKPFANRLYKVISFCLITIPAFITIPITTFAATTIISQWIELGPQNIIIARALSTQATCPIIKLDNYQQRMQIHKTATADFPFTVCQSIIPAHTKKASIAGQTLSLPKLNPTKIVIIGDTGCRLKDNKSPQGCDDPVQWPFANIADHAAAWKPDLVIHVGDYLYRESACPVGDKDCAGSPHGDNWSAWQADFFQPAKHLLQSAPWIFVRGNHETCDRAGQGWTYLLEPYNFAQCQIHSPLYSVDIGNTRLFIMDSSYAADYTAPADQVSQYDSDLAAIANSPAPHNWIITHKPFWFIYDDSDLNTSLQSLFMNTLETAWSDTHLTNVDAIFSGHVHRFQTINFADATHAPQIIVGASGTRLLTTLDDKQLNGFTIAGSTISQGISLDDFGYLTLEKQATGWQGQIRNTAGNVIANCSFQKKQFICEEAAGVNQ